MNHITLLGNLASDVTVRDRGDQKVGNFLLAVDRPKSETSDFIPVTVWNGQAEACEKYLSKGNRVAVEGSLRTSTYEKDGEKRKGFEVQARGVTFLTPRSGAPEAAPEPSTAPPAPADDDIPF